MKKIFALIIAFIFLTSNAGFAFSELYYLHNISEQKANSIVKTSLQNLNYRLESENPYYAIYNKNPDDNAVIIIQASGSNVYYYYYTEKKRNKELNNALLRTFRSYRINYDNQSQNTNVLNVYDNIAQKTISSSGSINKYDFGDDDNNYITTSTKRNVVTIPQQYNYSNSQLSQTYNPQITYNNQNQNNTYKTNTYTNTNTNAYSTQNNTKREPRITYPANTQYVPYDNNNTQTAYLTPGTTLKSQQATVLKGSVVSIDSGTKINTYLQNPINTASANVGDKVVVVLTDDLKYNGVLAIPQGSLVYGTLSKARHATYGSRNGRVVIEFNQLVTPDNKVYEISAEKIDFTVTNDGKVGRTVGNAVAGAAVGALAGLLFGALGGGNIGTAAAIGAGVGAGTSLIGSGAERGVDAEIPSFTQLELTLTKPVRVSVSY